MIIHEIHDLTNHYVIDLMKKEYSSITDQNFRNYHPDFSDHPGNIFKILNDGRYARGNGKYYVIEIDGKLAASAGWNKYELQSDIALILSRMYVAKQYRSKYLVGYHILPSAVSEAFMDHNKLWMTFNENNFRTKKWFTYVENKSSVPSLYSKFKFLDYMDVYYVKQFVYQYKIS